METQRLATRGLESGEGQASGRSHVQDAPVAQSPSRPITLSWPSLALLAVLLLAAFLRFYHLTASSLWHDEGNTWALIQRSFAQIAQASAADIHPPGYYWLLKLWSLAFGSGAWGMRSFSAVTGVLLVALVYSLGRRLPGGHRTGLLAAFLAAVNPFLVYYSQEARMYMLLALESAGLFWALLAWMGGEDGRQKTADEGQRLLPFSLARHFLLYTLFATLGLWTHYSFPVVLAAAGLAFLAQWKLGRGWRAPRAEGGVRNHPITGSPNSLISNFQSLIPFLSANVLALLLYAPWLPTAVDRVLSWPKGGESTPLLEGLALTLQTLAVGPIRSGPALAWPWLLLAGLLPLVGLARLWQSRRPSQTLALGLWFLAPMAMMFALGLFSDAFLPFIIVSWPAWCLLVAASGSLGVGRWWKRGRPQESLIADLQPLVLRRFSIFNLGSFVFLLATLLAGTALPGYYADPSARDNYAGMARTVRAMGDPSADLVLLDAPGQQEVWAYYDPGLPVLALPQERPPDRGRTEALLADAVANRRQIFALFWALDEADPEKIVESWLDRHAFKGLESWQGNVRFVIYSLPNDLTCRPLEPPVRFGDLAELTQLCQPRWPQEIVPGQMALVGLTWRPLVETERRYKVTVQLLDARSQVVAQRDSEPVGGSRPTVTWAPGESIRDNYGLLAPPGTPPGVYSLILALYDGETGQRLLTASGQDFAGLGQVTVQPSQRSLPLDVVPMQHRLGRALGPVTLVGYDAYRKGFAHAPETPVPPGEPVHVTLYWQAPDPLPEEWPADLRFTLSLGQESLTAPLAGGGYPTGQWQPGQFVRGEFDIRYDGTGTRLVLQVGEEQIRLGRIPAQK